MSKREINIFKEYLMPKAPYSGGKGIKEVQSLVKGKPIYKLSSNENALGASPKALQTLKQNIEQIHQYPERSDIRLRKALDNFYQGKVAFEQFITENSGVALIENICRAFLSEGDEVIVSNPCFKPYIMFTKRCGAQAIDVPLEVETFALNVEGILDKISDRTRLVFLTNPNNPTGTTIAKDDLDNLLKGLPEHVVLVIDEVYYQFVEDQNFSRAYEYLEQGHQVIGINSFSKAYGLAGMRIGYAYSSPEIAAYLRQLNRPFNLDTLTLEAAIAALSDQAFIDQIVKLVKEEKKYLYAELDKLGVKYWKSEANFILIKPGISSKLFEQKMLEEGVMVRPVDKFGAPDCVRVTIGTHEANRAYIDAFKKIINE